MKHSTVCQLAASSSNSLVAAADHDSAIGTWDARTGHRISSFASVYEAGGFRLALNACGSRCAAASYYSGKRGGVACYSVRSAKLLWHRTDIRHTQYLRFSSDGKTVYCSLNNHETLCLSAADGKTSDDLFGVKSIHESRGRVLMVCSTGELLLDGATQVRIPHRPGVFKEGRHVPCLVNVVAFGPREMLLAEIGGIWKTAPNRKPELTGLSSVRSADFSGAERWRVETPQPGMITEICYRTKDRRFYGVERDYQAGKWCHLVRYSKGGAAERICNVTSCWSDLGFCAAGDLLVSHDGAVVEVQRGRLLRRLNWNRPS